MKTNELREMSDEQLVLTLKDTEHNLFRLRMQAQTERLDAPSELRRHRRMIAQIKTIQGERTRKSMSVPANTAATVAAAK
jgi:large subunit ribosomal protein L29